MGVSRVWGGFLFMAVWGEEDGGVSCCGVMVAVRMPHAAAVTRVLLLVTACRFCGDARLAGLTRCVGSCVARLLRRMGSSGRPRRGLTRLSSPLTLAHPPSLSPYSTSWSPLGSPFLLCVPNRPSSRTKSGSGRPPTLTSPPSSHPPTPSSRFLLPPTPATQPPLSPANPAHSPRGEWQGCGRSVALLTPITRACRRSMPRAQRRRRRRQLVGDEF